jgi:hypothetical protein
MSFNRFLQQFFWGWVPEEPKLPKRRVASFRVPAVTFIAVTSVTSLFSLIFVFLNVTVLFPPPLVIESAPNSSYVELSGVSDYYNNTYLLFLTNGTRIDSENLTLSYTITKQSSDKCTVNIAIECDTFSNQTTLDGNIENGNLVIDSMRSLFLINPNLTKNQKVVLAETPDWKRTATVISSKSRASTTADRYYVKPAIAVLSKDSESSGPFYYMFSHYSPNTGALVSFGGRVSDVILKKLGIDVIINGNLYLNTYSENLDIDVINYDNANFTNFGFVLFLSSVFTAIVLSTRFVVQLIRKKVKPKLLELFL